MTPIFVVVVSVLLPICCHIGWGMPYLGIFVEEVVTSLGAFTDKWVLTPVFNRKKNLSNDQVKGCSKKYKRYFFASELWVKSFGTFAVVL